MRWRGLILTAAGLWAFIVGKKIDQQFRSPKGRLATTFSSKWRARQWLIRRGTTVAWRTAIVGLIWSLIPKRKKPPTA